MPETKIDLEARVTAIVTADGVVTDVYFTAHPELTYIELPDGRVWEGDGEPHESLAGPGRLALRALIEHWNAHPNTAAINNTDTSGWDDE